MKQRSAAACIHEGFAFIGRHLRALLYSTWAYLLLTAALLAPYLIIFFNTLSVPQGYELKTSVLVIMYLLYVLYNLSMQLLIGRVFHLFREYRDHGIVPRLKPFQELKTTCKMALRSFIFSVWIMILSAPGLQLMDLVIQWIPMPQGTLSLTLFIIGLVLVCVLVVICLLPLVFTYYKYVLDGEPFLQMVGKSYKQGSHYKGRMIAAILLSTILLSVILAFLMLPMLILSVASSLSNIGQMMGDPSGLPSYFQLLMGVTFFLSLAILIYVSFASYTTMFYVYGSIEAQEKERDTYLTQTSLES